MSEKVQDFVQQVNKQDFSAAKGSFESAIAEKISAAFENKKIDLASQMSEGTMFSESKQRPIKFSGKTFTDYKVFNSDREANEFLEKNDDYGVIGEKGGKVYVAKNSDLGESKSVPDKHQEKIAKDTLRNPNKSLMGGPSAKEAEEILRNKFGYSTAQIKKLKESTRINERKTRQMVDPDKEAMVVKNGNVKVIDKKDLDKFMKKGYELAEGTQITESRDNYYKIGGDRYDGGVVVHVYVRGKKVYDEIIDGQQDYKYKGKEYRNIFKLLDAIAKDHSGVSSGKDFRRVEMEGTQITESQMVPNWLVKQYEKRAENERRGGGMIDINYRLPTVAVELSDGSEYFFQEYEAQDLIDEVPENISPEDFILASAQSW